MVGVLMETVIEAIRMGGPAVRSIKLKIISWNVRGANEPTKRLGIKSFFKEGKGEIVCLQEHTRKTGQTALSAAYLPGENYCG